MNDHAHSCGYFFVLRLIKHHSSILVLCVGKYMQNDIILGLVKGKLKEKEKRKKVEPLIHMHERKL